MSQENRSRRYLQIEAVSGAQPRILSTLKTRSLHRFIAGRHRRRCSTMAVPGPSSRMASTNLLVRSALALSAVQHCLSSQYDSDRTSCNANESWRKQGPPVYDVAEYNRRLSRAKW